MKPIWLVTGATGHLGNVLSRTLIQAGHAVRALILPGEDRTAIQGVPLEQVEGDVLDRPSLVRAMQGVRGVFHLAGVISILPGAHPFLHRVNVEGTQNILQAALEVGLPRLVYTSSIHAIRRLAHGQIDESVPYDAQNPYGEYDRSKAEATLSVLDAARRGLPAVVACPTGVIGPFDYRGSLMGAYIRDVASARSPFYVDGAYDFVDVRDVAQGLLSAASLGTPGESYILSGQRISISALLDAIYAITGRHLWRFKLPFALARFAANFTPWYYRLSGATPRFTPYSLEVLRSNSHISHAKASRELGYAPRPLVETLQDTLKWFLERRHITA